MYRDKFWLGLLTLSVVLFFVALVAHGYIGFFTRYFADDYCKANLLLSEGFIGVQRYYYTRWIGRFSSTLIISIVGIIGPRIVPFLPSIALALWLTAMTWVVLQFSSIVHLEHPAVASLLVAELVIFATLDTTPDVVASLYWQTGMLTYTVPLIILTGYIGLITHRLRRRPQSQASPLMLLLSASITFFAGGFSETYVTLQTSVLFLAIVMCMFGTLDCLDRAALPLILAGFAGSLVAMCFMIIAPGNAVRQACFPPPLGIVSFISASLQNALLFVGRSVLSAPLTFVVSLVLPTLLAFKLHSLQLQGIISLRSKNRHLATSLILVGMLLLSVTLAADWLGLGGEGFGTRQLAAVVGSLLVLLAGIALRTGLASKRAIQLFMLLFITGFALIVICFAPSAYGMSSFPPGRALVTPQFILIIVTACWGYLAGLALRQVRSLGSRSESPYFTIVGFVVVAALLTLGPIASARRTFAKGATVSAYASQWDRRDREIRAARSQGITDLVVPALGDTGGWEELSPDPNYWVNECVAEYYGLDSIAAK